MAIATKSLGEPAGDAAVMICLLYTSDAADERSSVDLGGRRIIKKKNRGLLVEYHENVTNTSHSRDE